MSSNFPLFEWFFIVDHKAQSEKASDPLHRHEDAYSKAVITYSCLDGQHSPQFLSRLRTIATELTIPFGPNHQQKLLHSTQLEFFYFENDDKNQDILYVACLLHWRSMTIHGIISRKSCFGEFQEVLQQISHLKPDADSLTLLVTDLYNWCKYSHIHLYSFKSSTLPSFAVKNKKFKLEDIALAELFTTLDLNDIIDLLCVLLVEGNVYVTSKKLNKISSAIFLITRLIRPFHWQQILIPLLSPNMLHLCSAPLPCIIGIHNSMLELARREIVETNLDNAPDPNNTGYYVLVSLDADKAEKFERLDNMHNRCDRVYDLFPRTYVYSLKSVWKSLLQKLSRCDMTIEEFAKCVLDSAHRFIAQLLLGYHSCFYQKKDLTDSCQTVTESENNTDELCQFDKEAFIASTLSTPGSGSGTTSGSSVKQSGAKYRVLLTQCQYFEQFINGKSRKEEVVVTDREKEEIDQYKHFDRVYEWVLHTEGEKRRNNNSSAANFNLKVDSAYSKLSEQKNKLQQEVKSKSIMVKKAVRNKLPDASNYTVTAAVAKKPAHRPSQNESATSSSVNATHSSTVPSSVFYVSPPTLIGHVKHSDSGFKLPTQPLNHAAMRSNGQSGGVGRHSVGPTVQRRSMFYLTTAPHTQTSPQKGTVHNLPLSNVRSKQMNRDDYDDSRLGSDLNGNLIESEEFRKRSQTIGAEMRSSSLSATRLSDKNSEQDPMKSSHLSNEVSGSKLESINLMDFDEPDQGRNSINATWTSDQQRISLQEFDTLFTSEDDRGDKRDDSDQNRLKDEDNAFDIDDEFTKLFIEWGRQRAARFSDDFVDDSERLNDAFSSYERSSPEDMNEKSSVCTVQFSSNNPFS
ncbi:uncharacterized protein LOC142345904 isoform X3 [Convolutriloba macropyga]|uniref:uncharacterized protein LOC142345904 isoform X3 n=1 Tax=Convolutriloba macropyga TaxID=536237 RepID=UPI003F51EF4A